MGKADAAAAELRLYVRQDPHSPKAERAIRAICSIKNIPYKDALKETAVEWQPKGSAIKKAEPTLGRKSTGQPPGVPTRKRANRVWGAIDVFILFLLVVCVVAWYAFPGQSKKLVASITQALENRYAFQVVNQAPGGSASAGNQ